MKKIDIRKLGKIGGGNIDAYNTQQNDYSETEKVKLRIGVFFDGTGNNRFNSESVYYNTKYSNLPLEEDKISQIKGLKSFVIESGSSYWNSYSNITLLHDLYEEKIKRDDGLNVKFQNLQLKFYIQGIGTLRDEKDDMLGTGFGEGERGVIARVEEACQNIADGIESALDAIKNKNTKKHLQIDSIQFDVFGFSRGAAAARHFCNEVLKTGREELKDRFGKLNDRSISRQDNQKNSNIKDFQAEVSQFKADATKKVKDNLVVPQKHILPTNKIFTGGLLGKLLKQKKISFPKQHVNVEFLGIFDTVISQMLERKRIIDKARNPIINALVAPFSPLLPILPFASLKLALIKKVNSNLYNPNIKKILHIKARTEWRDNFPITPVGEIKNPTYAKEISVFGAHSDVGGGYWQLKEEKQILHFFDISANADPFEKQKLELQKNLLRNWYISQKLCKNDQIEWKVMHHVKITVSNQYTSAPLEIVLIDEGFMGNDTVKTENNTIYTLVGYHYKLVSKRPLDNKLSLVYMNVMKYIALNYADVPFTLPTSETPHPEEYQLPEGDKKENDLQKYQELITKAAEHGWTNKEGKTTTYPRLVNDEGLYALSSETYNYIMGNFVHLSANFTDPLFETLDHYNFAYANVPHFTDEKEFKDPPYKREVYTPTLDAYDFS